MKLNAVNFQFTLILITLDLQKIIDIIDTHAQYKLDIFYSTIGTQTLFFWMNDRLRLGNSNYNSRIHSQSEITVQTPDHSKQPTRLL